MTLNKWLCKYFDKDNKGYGTVGDVWHIIPIVIFRTLATCLYLHGVYNCLWNGFVPTSTSPLIADVTFWWFIGITLVIVCRVLHKDRIKRLRKWSKN